MSSIWVKTCEERTFRDAVPTIHWHLFSTGDDKRLIAAAVHTRVHRCGSQKKKTERSLVYLSRQQFSNYGVYVPGTQVRKEFFLLFLSQPISVVTSATDALLVDARINVTPILSNSNALLATLGTKKSTQLQLGERTRKQSDWVRTPKLCCIESNASELVHHVWGQTVPPWGKHLVEALKRPFPASRRCRKTKQAQADGVPQRKAFAV